MAVTITSIDPIDELAYRIQFASDQPSPVTFRVFVDGVLVTTIVSQTVTAETRLTITPGTDPFIEVLDRPEARPSVAFSGYCLLSWDDAGAERYRVEQEIASVWTPLATILADGRPVYYFQTPWLADGQIYPFRIVPISAAGNDGSAMTRSVAQIRTPPVPDVLYSYSAATRNVTIDQA